MTSINASYRVVQKM